MAAANCTIRSHFDLLDRNRPGLASATAAHASTTCTAVVRRLQSVNVDAATTRLRIPAYAEHDVIRLFRLSLMDR